jgi:hypothetical protein
MKLCSRTKANCFLIPHNEYTSQIMNGNLSARNLKTKDNDQKTVEFDMEDLTSHNGSERLFFWPKGVTMLDFTSDVKNAKLE